MKYWICIIINLVILCSNCPPVMAQPKPVLQYYDVTSGLPSNHLYKMVQDKKGFLWIATENGISKFDGRNFKNFSVKEGLIDNDILDIFLDAAGNIWFIPFAGTPFYYDIVKEQIISERQEPALEKIQSRQFFSGHGLEDSSVCFFDHKTVYRYKNGRLTEILSFDFALKSGIAYYSMVYKKEYLITLTGDVYEIRNGRPFLIKKLGAVQLVRAGNSQHQQQAIINCNSMKMCLLQFYPGDRLPDFSFPAFGKMHANSTFLKDRIATAGIDKHIYFLQNNTLIPIDSLFTGADNRHVYEDKSGTLWVATADRGLIKITTPIIQNIELPAGKVKQIDALLKDEQGLYLGNATGEILIQQKGKWSILPKPENGYENQYLKKIIKYRGNVYVGGAYSFFAVEETTKSNYTDGRNYHSGAVKDLLNYRNATLYVGSSSYLSETTGDNNFLVAVDSNRSSCMAMDSAGRLYRGSKTGISLFRGNKLLPPATYDQVYKSNFVKLITTADGLVWGGSSNDTLYTWEDGRVISKIVFGQQSYGSLCKGLGSEKPGTLWYATNKGIVKITYRHANKKVYYSSYFYGSSDGLSDAVINDIQIFKDSLYMATSMGVKVMSCSVQPVENNIPVFLSAVLINSAPAAFSTKFVLNNESRDIQLIYTAIDFSGQPVRLQYKINNAGWEELNGTALTLTKMKAGSYKIKVRAINKDGLPSDMEFDVAIKVQAPFWQQGWFYALVSLLSVLAGMAILEFRSRQKRKIAFLQAEAIEQQREKITADLHDDIGASLSSVQINSAVATKLFHSNPEKSKVLLEKLEKQAQSLAERMSDFIWSMKPGKNEFLSLGTRIKNYASEILSAKEISFTVLMKDDADKLLTDFDLRKTVLLIAKEAINNAAKYSEANSLQVEFYRKNQVVFLEVCDNGIGLPQNFVAGNGIENMQKRTEELGGAFKILPVIPHGTKIKVSLPIP